MTYSDHYDVIPEDEYFNFGNWYIDKEMEKIPLKRHKSRNRGRSRSRSRSKSKTNKKTHKNKNKSGAKSTEAVGDASSYIVGSPRSVSSAGSDEEETTGNNIYVLKRNGKRMFPTLKVGKLSFWQ